MPNYSSILGMTNILEIHFFIFQIESISITRLLNVKIELSYNLRNLPLTMSKNIYPFDYYVCEYMCL